MLPRSCSRGTSGGQGTDHRSCFSTGSPARPTILVFTSTRPAADRRVLAIDFRGHGRSTHSFDEANYTVDHIVDDVIAWLSATIEGPVDLLGHSMGGRVALRFALVRRDLVHSLILMDTTAWKFGIDDPELSKLIVGSFESITRVHHARHSDGRGARITRDPARPHAFDDRLQQGRLLGALRRLLPESPRRPVRSRMPEVIAVRVIFIAGI